MYIGDRARGVVYILDIFDDGLWLAIDESVAAQRGELGFGVDWHCDEDE